MKPLLEPVEHTAEDAIAWAHVNWRGGPRFGPQRWTRSLMSDRRDAELMLTAVHGDASWWWNSDKSGCRRVKCRNEWFEIGGEPIL